MRVIRVGNAIEVWAPAKLNLFLEVVGRRDDGFHEIETLMVPVSLYDTLRFDADDGSDLDQLTVTLSPPLQRLPTDCPPGPQNLVLRAIDLLRSETNTQRFARIHLTKRIPTEAGLGGGSSDAAAAMIAANESWRLGLSTHELAELSSRLGSDIPFFFTGGAAICEGRGEVVRPAHAPYFDAVVLKPESGLSTKEVYQRVDLDSDRRSAQQLGALTDNRANLSTVMFNRLESSAALLSPWVGKLRTIFNRFELWGHQLSGSGSSYFGICRNSKHARRVARLLQASSIGFAFVVQTDLQTSGRLAAS